jgi:predicted Rossmann-fold nucleotide-binding protein
MVIAFGWISGFDGTDQPMLRKLPIVGVFGQGTPLAPERALLAANVGAMVARLGAHLLTGGGYGVMAAVAEGFVTVEDRRGWSIGIVPRKADGPLDMPNHDGEGRSYPNSSVEIAIRTPLPPRTGEWRKQAARNHINVFSAHAILALPGGPGTRNELDMAAVYLGEATRSPDERRTVLVGPITEFTPEHRASFVHADTPGAAEQHLRRILAAQGFHEASARAVP